MTKRHRESDSVISEDDTVFFFRETDPVYGVFCNWHFSLFTMKLCDGVSYLFYCGEQAIMAEKALLFKDTVMFRKIMQDGKYDTSLASFAGVYTPRYIKQLGRKVTGFDEKCWTSHIQDLAMSLCVAKFDPMNESVHLKLMETGSSHIAEASKYDRVWGIGYDASSARRQPRHKWGKNILGKALMRARAHFSSQENK